MAAIPDLPSIGKNLHVLRKKNNLTMDSLAGRSGVSKAMLSQIEQGKVNPTIATLWKIAHGLSVDFSSLLGADKHDRHFFVQRAEDATIIKNAVQSCELRALTPLQMVDELEMYWLTFKPKGKLVSNAHFALTEEIVTVINGSVEVKSGEKSVVLNKGDSIRYHADVEHAIHEAAGKKSEAFLTVYFKEKKV